MASPKPKRTEAELLAMLRDRYTETAGNGDAWAFIPKVRDAAGFDAKRTIDALAMSLWPSRGLLLYGFEIKCSRSDWLRELKNPAKAESFGRLMDFFYLVVADDTIIKDGELPEPWGLLVVQGKRLVQKVEAKALHDLTPQSRKGTAPLPEGLSRSFVAALLRSACRTSAALPEELRAEYERGRRDGKAGQVGDIERLRKNIERHEERERRFQQISGVSLTDYRDVHGHEHLEEVAAALKATLDGDTDLERLTNRLKSMRRTGADLLDAVDRTLAVYEGKQDQLRMDDAA